MTTAAPPPTHRLIATVLVLCLAAGPLLSSFVLAQAGDARIRGIVYATDGSTRLIGATVIAIDVTTGEKYSSALTGENGAYEITGLPAGTYDIVVESGGLLFVADNLVDLSANQRFSVSYVIQPQRPASRAVQGLPDPAGAADVVGDFEGLGAVGAAKESIWARPGTATALIVLMIGAGLAIANNLDDDDGSPSTP